MTDRDKIIEVMARRFRALGLTTAEAQRGANEALHALEASGMAVVPVEPSDERLNAICHAINLHMWKPGPWKEIALHVYAAALSAHTQEKDA